MRSEEEIREVLNFLKKIYDSITDKDLFNTIDVCITCKKVNTGCSIFDHTVVWSDMDHDGIHEWIRALEWVLGGNPTYQRARVKIEGTVAKI